MATNPISPASPEKRENSRIIIIVLAALLVAMAGVSGYFIYTNSAKSTEIENLNAELEKLDAEIKAQDKDIERLENDLTATAQEKEQAQTQLQELQGKIRYFQGQISKITAEKNLTAAELEKLKGKAEQLEFYNKKYQEKIAQLESEIQSLKAENTQLKGELEEKSTAISKLERETKQKADVINEGSKLVADGSSFSFSGVNQKGKTVDPNRKGELKAKKLKVVKVCCKLNENRIAPGGSHELLLVLKGPNGVYKTLGAGSGYFKLDGGEEVYSSKSTISYGNRAQQVCLEYDAGASGFQTGTHTAIVYALRHNSDAGYYEVGRGTVKID